MKAIGLSSDKCHAGTRGSVSFQVIEPSPGIESIAKTNKVLEWTLSTPEDACYSSDRTHKTGPTKQEGMADEHRYHVIREGEWAKQPVN